MRVLFAGSPAIAVPTLEKIAHMHEVVGVVTNPPSASGRSKTPSATDVALAADKLFGDSVPVFTFDRLGKDAREAVAKLSPDILVVFAYGKIFGPKFLELFPKGGINIHPSLLPLHRGASPIQNAILSRDAETGVSVQKLAMEMDCGDIFAVQRIDLRGNETGSSLSEVSSRIGADLATKVLSDIEEGRADPKPQSGEISYCAKISKEDGLVDWNMGTLEIDARIRAFEPWPLAYTFLDSQRLSILEAQVCDDFSVERLQGALPPLLPGTILAIDRSKGIVVRTGDGYLALTRLQVSARKALHYKDFANGVRNLVGKRLRAEGGELD